MESDEINSKEGHYIRTLECINKYIPDRIRKEWNQYYYEQNKEIIKQKHKDVYDITKKKVKKKIKIMKTKLNYKNKNII
jgi:hypothetical protein